jgi:NADH-quinone oxidoreductase subunit L
MTSDSFDPMVLTLVLPLLGALLVGTAGRHMGKAGSAFVASAAVGCSFLVVLWTIIGKLNGVEVPESVHIWQWMSFPGLPPASTISFGIYVDALSLTLMSVVTGVGFLIHWYSSEYMEHDADVPRFFTLMNLFIAAMTFLVLADNYATLILGWGGVGFASFALIGFWREKPSAAAAAKKAFVMNVIGDIGLMVAVFVLFKYAGTVDYVTLFEQVLPNIDLARDRYAVGWLTVVTIGLMVAAYAKSAQLPLHTWLPDAMEGPTPVSALIHAATMVTAGVYLLVRSSMFLQLVPDLATAIAYLGAVTALFAACCAMVQTDLKRVLAYSTMSQLGYMFMAVGLGAYGAAIFHLVTHAFFKALLFLSAGMVIHAAHGEQDMRKLGGLGRQMPATAVLFAVGGLALAGIPPTSGFFSKESILHAAHEHSGGMPLFVIGALVAVMTAFYTGRAFFLTFLGPARIEHPHLPGAPTTTACALLWLLAMGGGFLYPNLTQFLDPTQQVSGFAIEPGALSVAAITLSIVVLLALIAAYAMFGRGAPDRFGGETAGLQFVRRGIGFDDFYGFLARGFDLMGQLGSRVADPYFQDGLPGFLGRAFHSFSYVTNSSIQTGQTRYYMAALTLFLAIFLAATVGLHGALQR